MKVTIKFYARFADKFGKEFKLELTDDINLDDLMKIMMTKFTDLAKEKNLLVSINDRIIEGNRVVKDGDVISIFPPPGGG